MTRSGATLLVSDLHLAPDTAAVTERFFSFLSGPATHARRLIILGDLFDAWAGDDDLSDPFNQHITGALKALSQRGVTIEFMCGNRDFLVGNDFAEAAGLTLLPDPCVRDIAGTRTLLTHGDLLCSDDNDYQQFRATVRTPEWRAAFLGLPLAERQRQIAALRQRSESEKQIKSMAIMDVNDAAVRAAFSNHYVDTIIHGHTHRQQQHNQMISGTQHTRWVLGDWTPDTGQALTCSPAGWHFTT